jgi:hypothetical protein
VDSLGEYPHIKDKVEGIPPSSATSSGLCPRSDKMKIIETQILNVPGFGDIEVSLVEPSEVLSSSAKVAESYDETVARLKPAFDLVKNPEHWKDAINTVVTEEQIASVGGRETIEEAVIFYTGSIPEFSKSRKKGTFRVRALGYWAVIGA